MKRFKTQDIELKVLRAAIGALSPVRLALCIQA